MMNKQELENFKRCFGDIDGEVFLQVISGITNRIEIENVVNSPVTFIALLRLCNLGILQKISDDEFVLNDNIDDLQVFLNMIPFIPRSKEEIYNLYREKKGYNSDICSCGHGDNCCKITDESDDCGCTEKKRVPV